MLSSKDGWSSFSALDDACSSSSFTVSVIGGSDQNKEFSKRSIEERLAADMLRICSAIELNASGKAVQRGKGLLRRWGTFLGEGLFVMQYEITRLVATEAKLRRVDKQRKSEDAGRGHYRRSRKRNE